MLSPEIEASAPCVVRSNVVSPVSLAAAMRAFRWRRNQVTMIDKANKLKGMGMRWRHHSKKMDMGSIALSPEMRAELELQASRLRSRNGGASSRWGPRPD